MRGKGREREDRGKGQQTGEKGQEKERVGNRMLFKSTLDPAPPCPPYPIQPTSTAVATHRVVHRVGGQDMEQMLLSAGSVQHQ